MYHRIAVIGSGPSGMYATQRLLKHNPSIRIDIFERYNQPFGLVNYGVAPDHPEIKTCTTKFQQILSDPRVLLFTDTLVGNVDAFVDYYDAVVVAAGCDRPRLLNIPGESDNIISARRWIGWINQEPGYTECPIKVTSLNRVCVVGHGNVALDVARVLLKRDYSKDFNCNVASVLRQFDTRHVDLIGRRGSWQMSFTTKEIREMLHLFPLSLDEKWNALLINKPPNVPRARERLVELINNHKIASDPKWSLKFLMAPIEARKDKLICTENDLLGDTVQSNGKMKEIECDLIISSVGYEQDRSLIPWVRFVGGRIECEYGSRIRKRLYGCGWYLTGAQGVLASTMMSAYSMADQLLQDISELQAKNRTHPINLNINK